MLSKKEMIDFVWETVQDLYNRKEMYCWADLGDKLGLYDGCIRLESDCYHTVAGIFISMQYKTNSHHANTYRDISDFFDKYYPEMEQDDKRIQDIIKGHNYYKKRWSLLLTASNNIIINQTPTCTHGKSIAIYRQITGNKIENYNNIIKQNIELIESIDEELWKLGEFFVNNNPYLVSPIQSITREGDQIYIKAAPDLSQEFIANDKVLKFFFTNSDFYAININEVDNLLMVLDLIKQPVQNLWDFR